MISCSQGLAFLPKTECNVRDVEIAVGLMLTKTTIEPVAFRVPRVKVSRMRRLVDARGHCASFCLIILRLLFFFLSPERVFPGRCVPRHDGVVGAGADCLRLALWLQRPTQKDEPEA